MSREKGVLKVSKKLGGTIKRGKNKLSIPKLYELAPRERFNNKECEYELEGGTITKVFVDGQELPKDTAAEKRKEERKQAAAEAAERERIAKEEAKKNAALNAKFKTDSFDVKKAFCPSDTGDLNIQPYKVENFALKLNRFARFVENDYDYSKSKFEFLKMNRGKVEHQIIANYGGTDFDAIAKRAVKNANVLLNGNCEDFTKKTSGRLITGLGGASVYETDITLHHIYGFPYLPASGIKGVVRSWIIQNVFTDEAIIKDENKQQEEGDKKSILVNAEFRAYQDEAFCEIFGCPSKAKKIRLDGNGNKIKDEKNRIQYDFYDVALKDKKGKGQEHQGKVQFFDAFPTKPPKIEADVMTPHYGDYYSKDNVAPTDTMSPKPVTFLTVADTPFQFLFGSKKFDITQKLWELEIEGETKNGTLLDWLKSALENHGIGAKTAVGYGYMS